MYLEEFSDQIGEFKKHLNKEEKLIRLSEDIINAIIEGKRILILILANSEMSDDLSHDTQKAIKEYDKLIRRFGEFVDKSKK